MEINYQTIINYLSESKNRSEFPIRENIMKYSKYFPNEFSNYFSNNFFIYGVKSSNNLSVYSSVLHLLNDKYILFDSNEKNDYINTIKSDLREYVKKNHKNFSNKSKFSKHYSLEVLNSDKFSPLILELFCFCFRINIIIFDFKNNTKSIVNSDDVLNPWFPTIILSKYDNYFAPIYNNDNKYFNYESNFIKTILNSDIEYFESKFLDKEYTLLDNLKDIMKYNFDYVEENNSNNDTFLNKDSIKISKSKLQKMRKNDIIKYVKEFNLNVNVTQTKDKIIKEILLA